MTAQQLKNSILQMAVQGKLVPQDPNDEPASVLLERIKAEKQELIKAGKIKKDKKPSEIFRGASRNLPYAFCEQVGKEIRDISDEVPFEIPDSWEWVRLGIISTYNQTKLKINAKDANVSIWGLDLEDIEKGGRLLVKKTVGERKAVGDKTVFSKGDILYSKLRPYLLKILVAPDNGICTPEIVPFTAYGNISAEYIVSFLKSPYVDGLVNGETYGIKMPRAGTETMISLLVPLPPIPEQHRIVAKIEELLPYIEKYAHAETQLTALNTSFPEALKKSILQEAVQGRLVPQDPNDEPASVILERIRAEKQALVKAGKIKKDKHESVIVTRDKIPYEIIDGKERCIAEEVPFEIPEGWCWCRLKTLLKKSSTGPFGSMLHKSDYANDGVPLINPADIINGEVSTLKIKKVSFDKAEKMVSYRLYKGDIVIGRRGELGRAAIITDTEDRFLCGTGCFFVTLFPGFDAAYFIKLLESPYLRLCLQEKSVGTTMNNLNHTILENLLIPLPPLSEQHRIVTKIEQLLPIINQISK